MRKITFFLISFLFTTFVHANTINPKDIIKFFDVCSIKSSLGQMCKMDSFNSYEYFKGLDEVIKDNKAHYKEGDFWEFYFTIEEQNNEQAMITFEDLALSGTYKSIETLVFKKDNDNWKLYSIKNVYPNNEKEFKIISD